MLYDSSSVTTLQEGAKRQTVCPLVQMSVTKVSGKSAKFVIPDVLNGQISQH